MLTISPRSFLNKPKAQEKYKSFQHERYNSSWFKLFWKGDRVNSATWNFNSSKELSVLASQRNSFPFQQFAIDTLRPVFNSNAISCKLQKKVKHYIVHWPATLEKKKKSGDSSKHLRWMTRQSYNCHVMKIKPMLDCQH